MITSDNLYVWIWLPGAIEPVVAGKLTAVGKRILFTYGQGYLDNAGSISIHDGELPLRSGVHEKKDSIEPLFGCIRDSAPDAWGRRVILNRLLGVRTKDADPVVLHEFIYLLESGFDRIGALGFSSSSAGYAPEPTSGASLEELLHCAQLVAQGVPLSPELALILSHGSSIGGANPKVMLSHNNEKYIAKFSLGTDQYSIVKAEFVAMRMASLCGLDVATVDLLTVSDKDVLLVKRFDRNRNGDVWTRRLMLSALTLLGLDEMTPHYASYVYLAEIIRHRFIKPRQTLHEMFARMVFNILVGNTDDHARNHAAFWDGKQLALTPAYDICPQLRHGGEATQAMMICGTDKTSRLATCLASANNFMLREDGARAIIDAQVGVIRENWNDVCQDADLSASDNELFRERLFLNPYAFYGY